MFSFGYLKTRSDYSEKKIFNFLFTQFFIIILKLVFFMSQCLVKSFHLLWYLSDSPSKKNLLFLLKNADDNLLNSFTEIFHNLLSGSVPITSDQRRILFGKHKKDFLKLSLKSFNNHKKKKLLIKLFPIWAKLLHSTLKTLKSLCE